MEDNYAGPGAETAGRERDTARFVALFLLGAVLFSPLLMSVFDAPGVGVFGIPLLFVYLFAGWAALIALAAWLSQSIGNGPTSPPMRPEPIADGGG